MHPAPLPLLPLSSLNSFVQGFLTWPQSSQEHARRNAMLAATACAQRRLERQEVEDYFAGLAGPLEAGSAQARAK